VAWRPSHLSQHNLPPSLLLLLVCSTNSVTDFDDEALLVPACSWPKKWQDVHRIRMKFILRNI
jgi:hypothetical protein